MTLGMLVIDDLYIFKHIHHVASRTAQVRSPLFSCRVPVGDACWGVGQRMDSREVRLILMTSSSPSSSSLSQLHPHLRPQLRVRGQDQRHHRRPRQVICSLSMLPRCALSGADMVVGDWVVLRGKQADSLSHSPPYAPSLQAPRAGWRCL
eukprot:2964669-Rhodomonas_salina.1